MNNINPKFTATVKNGELLMFKPREFSDFLKNLEGKKIYIVIKKEQSPRSLQQNRYYWGVVVKLLTQELGYTDEEAHFALKIKFLSKEGKIPTVESTADLTTVEFEEYILQIREWSQAFLNCYIPTPNEVDF